MKRKIFTLLAAFLALAAFQMNAQIAPFDGKSVFILNGYDLGKGYDQYAGVPTKLNNYSTCTGSLAIKNGLFVYQDSPGELGNTTDYFLLTETSNGSRRYTITSKSGTPFQYSYGNVTYKEWEFTVFPSITTAVALEPRENAADFANYGIMGGGYLLPASGTPYNTSNRLLLVRNAANELSVVTYSEYTADKSRPANTKQGYSPMFIRGNIMASRWANPNDFKGFPDFIQLKDQNGRVLTTTDPAKPGSKYTTFKVAYVNNMEGGKASPNFGVDLGARFQLPGTTDSVIPLFSFVSPDGGSQLLTIAKNKNILNEHAPTSFNVFGDEMILTGAYDQHLPNTDPMWQYYQTQQFAIWIDINGGITLYPYGAWQYVHGGSTSLALQTNLAVTGNDHAHGTSGTMANRYFKIDTYNSLKEFVVGPTTLDAQTIYLEANFMVKDVTIYNEIPAERYFYIQSNIVGQHGDKMVLDAVNQEGPTFNMDGKYFRKLVLSDRPRATYDAAQDTKFRRYYDIPYDSLNLSCYWQFQPIYNHPGDAKPVGYVIKNEMSDTLRYSDQTGWVLNYPDPYPGQGHSVTNMHGQLQFYMYPDHLPKYPNTNPANLASKKDTVLGNSVWKVLQIEGGNPDKIFLQNAGGGIYELGGMTIDPKFIKGNITHAIDTTRQTFFDFNPSGSPYKTWPLVPSAGWGEDSTLYQSMVRYGYYNSNSKNPHLPIIDTDGNVENNSIFKPRLTYYWGAPHTYLGVSFASGADGILERNVTSYSEPILTGNKVATSQYYGMYHDMRYFTYGLEMELAQIKHGFAKHDSISKGVQEWERYAVDSLFNYMYRTGSWAIQEAVSYKFLFKSDADGWVYAGLPDSQPDGDTVRIELADSLILANYWNATGTNYTVDKTNDPYKWFYLKKGKKYLTVEDTEFNRPKSDSTRYQLRFTSDNKENAFKFRFYQPLVQDKMEENHIFEVYLPEFYYKPDPNYNGVGDLKYLVDESKGNNGRRENLFDGLHNTDTAFVRIATQSDRVQIAFDVIHATRWHFTLVEKLMECPIGYIDNDYLADTRMYGAPMHAEVYNTHKNVPNPFTNSFITSYGNEESANGKKEDDVAVTFVLIPAGKIVNGEVRGGFVAADGTEIKEEGRVFNATPAYASDAKQPFVQLYYVKMVNKKNLCSAKEDSFLTATELNVYAQDLNPQMVTSVNGSVLKFQKAIPTKQAGVICRDTMLLQMFAVYGRLGQDEDRGKKACIVTDEEYHFGEFSFVPAAAVVYDFNNKKSTHIIERNAKLGNSNMNDEWRVGRYAQEENAAAQAKTNQLIVSAGDVEPVAPNEYVFSYRPFIQDFECPNFIDKGCQQGLVADGRTADIAGTQNAFYRDYADPSMQWSVNRPSKSKLNEFTYRFDCIGKGVNSIYTGKVITRTQAWVTRTELMDDYYLYLIDSTRTEFNGYDRYFTVVKKYVRSGQMNAYDIKSINSKKDIRPMEVVQITNKHQGDEYVTKPGDLQRTYYGDSTIDYYKSFTDEELYAFDWSIIEAVYKDRYVWSRQFTTPQTNEQEAYIDTLDRRYLSLRRSYTFQTAACDGSTVHKVEYFNIVYTDPKDGREYFLEIDQAGVATFKWLNATQRKELEDLTNHDTYLGMKFCFPYKMKKFNSIEYVGEGGYDPNENNSPATNPYYDLGQVYVQTMAKFDASNLKQIVDPYLLKVTSTSARLDGKNLGLLYDANYINDYADTWFFGDSGDADEEWVRLQGVPGVTESWLRDASVQQTGNDNLVIRATESEIANANNVVYGELSNKFDIKNTREGGYDAAKLKFIFIDSTYLGSYNKKKIWYYNIVNDKGEYLTSAGFDPAGTKPSADMIWKGEGYAYFTKTKLTGADTYKQKFGLKYKPGIKQPKPLEEHIFWVVAGVNPVNGNGPSSKFYYMASVNDRLVFRYTAGGTAKQAVEQSALPFQNGTIADDGTYTGKEDLNTDVFTVYGVEGAVKVANAQGLVELFSIEGRLLKSVNAESGVQTITAPKGVVIVKNGANVAKVVVK